MAISKILRGMLKTIVIWLVPLLPFIFTAQISFNNVPPYAQLDIPTNLPLFLLIAAMFLGFLSLWEFASKIKNLFTHKETFYDLAKPIKSIDELVERIVASLPNTINLSHEIKRRIEKIILKHYKAKFKDFLKFFVDKTQNVCVVNGKWGDGKTSFVNLAFNEETIEEVIPNDEAGKRRKKYLKNIKRIHFSLIEYLKVEDAEKDIVFTIISNLPFYKRVEITFSLILQRLQLAFSNSGVNIVIFPRNLPLTAFLIKKYNDAKTEPLVIILDDIDRLPPNQLVQFLNFVVYLRQFKNLKIVLPVDISKLSGLLLTYLLKYEKSVILHVKDLPTNKRGMFLNYLTILKEDYYWDSLPGIRQEIKGRLEKFIYPWVQVDLTFSEEYIIHLFKISSKGKLSKANSIVPIAIILYAVLHYLRYPNIHEPITELVRKKLYEWRFPKLPELLQNLSSSNTSLMTLTMTTKIEDILRWTTILRWESRDRAELERELKQITNFQDKLEREVLEAFIQKYEPNIKNMSLRHLIPIIFKLAREIDSSKLKKSKKYLFPHGPYLEIAAEVGNRLSHLNFP